MMISPYALAYREQQQLFEYDWSYIKDVVSQPGGFSALAARFFAQFYYSPCTATIITVLLLALSAYLAWDIFRKHAGWLPALLISACPALFLCVSLMDNSLHYDILTGFIFTLAGLNLYFYKRLHAKAVSRLVTGLLLTVVLFFIAGPFALIFAITACVLDIFSLDNRKAGILSLTYIAAAALIGWIAWQKGSFGTAASIVLPDFFYEPAEQIKKLHYIFWFSLPAAAIAASLIGACRKGALKIASAAVLLIISFFAAQSLSKKAISRNEEEFYKCEYLTINGRWSELAKESGRNTHQYLMANYYNLAQAEMGTLTENLFKAPQNGPQSLVYFEGGNNLDVRLAHVLYSMGDLAGAQKVAFNLLQDKCGYNPSMMKIVAEIDIKRGSFRTAEKYLSMLKKAPHYKAWAEAQKMEASPESFPIKEDFVLNGSTMNDLFNIIDGNPANAHAMEYAISYLLLCKDVTNASKLITEYYGSDGLKVLPTPAQEALIFFYDYFKTTDKDYALSHGVTESDYDSYSSLEPDFLLSHGVTEETARRFDAFKAEYGKSRGSHPISGYQDTFWNYMLFTKI